MEATSSAPNAQSSVRSSAWRIVMDVPEPVAAHGRPDGLRLRRCCDPSCNAVFAICRSCDHGQRYCSAACRKRRRSQQLRAAGRRYQATDAGRLAHRCRQREYRQRDSEASVTHQGASSVKLPLRSPVNLSRCAICGRDSRWNDTFGRLPRRWPRPAPRAKAARRPNLYVLT
jgi:hypothetical protein